VLLTRHLRLTERGGQQIEIRRRKASRGLSRSIRACRLTKSSKCMQFPGRLSIAALNSLISISYVSYALSSPALSSLHILMSALHHFAVSIFNPDDSDLLVHDPRPHQHPSCSLFPGPTMLPVMSVSHICSIEFEVSIRSNTHKRSRGHRKPEEDIVHPPLPKLLIDEREELRHQERGNPARS